MNEANLKQLSKEELEHLFDSEHISDEFLIELVAEMSNRRML